MLIFFFKQKTAYELRISDWSSDVCSSDLFVVYAAELAAREFGTFARSLRDGITRHQLTIEGEPLRLRALVGYASLQSGFEDAGAALDRKSTRLNSSH